MRILADLHISLRTVEFLSSLGHDIIRVTDILPTTAPDEAIVQQALEKRRVILTQDLDFSAIIALGGRNLPSLISLRLHSSRIEHVNDMLEKILPTLEQDVLRGVIVTVEDNRVRRRPLPVE